MRGVQLQLLLSFSWVFFSDWEMMARLKLPGKALGGCWGMVWKGGDALMALSAVQKAAFYQLGG